MRRRGGLPCAIGGGWNNLAVLRRRDAFDPKMRRVMYRTRIKGSARIALAMRGQRRTLVGALL